MSATTRNRPSLPPAGKVIAVARAVLEGGGSADDAARALDVFAPAVDRYADAAAAAEWLGISRASVYRERSRTRENGMPGWPQPDLTAGRSGLWRYRTIAVHRASLPGRGSAGRGRPASGKPRVSGD